MSEKGIIKEDNTAENKIAVEFQAGGACKSCGICITSNGPEASKMVVWTENTLGAKIGDAVSFEIKDGETLKAALWLYGFPIGLFLVGFILGQKLAIWTGLSQDALGIIFAASFFALAFYILNRREKQKNPRQQDHVRLLAILNKKEQS
jgi:sigma-E factor negative regulatory protein RseC